MMGPTKNLTILSCEEVDFVNFFVSAQLAKHSGLMKNILATVERESGEFKFYIVDGDAAMLQEIQSEFLHSDPEGAEEAKPAKIESFCILEGDVWFAIIILADGRIYRSTVGEFMIEKLVFEQIGAVEGGISGAAWSPDGNVVVLVTRLNRRILLSRDFEAIEEGPVQVEDYGSEEMISIGWGKKETQFHGTLGKAAAIAVAQAKMEPVDGDDGAARISWRADGSFFAISIIDADAGRRIRVYDRSGNLLSTSEPVEGLEASLAWRPNGSIIASTQYIKAQNRRQVIFFEKNGLRHGEFVLEDPKRLVKDLYWSSDSNVLAVTYNEEGGSADIVELWSSSNYHWYLKKSLSFNDSIKCITWDTEKLLLNIASVSSAFTFSLVWDQTVDNSCVLIVDGRTLHLTPLSISNIPPPLSLYQLNIDNCSVVQAAALKCVDSKEQIYKLAVVKKGFIEIFSVKLSVKRAECSYSLLASFAIEYDVIQIESSSDGFTALAKSGLQLFVIDDKNKLSITDLREKCVRIMNNSNKLFFAEGIVQDSIEGNLEFCSNLMNKGEWCAFLSKENAYLVMNEKGWLWVNDTLIMNQATSFSVTEQFILITTHTHQLIFLPRTLEGSIDSWEHLAKMALEGQSGNEELQRRVERGALLVSAVPEASAVVLQMPRGNLETVNPRAMVLSNLRQHLNALEYRAAYALCRRHRIDLNMLHDHAPELFIQTIGKFVKDLESVDHLNIFLSSLRDEDVTKTKYSGFKSGSAAKEPTSFLGKINSVSEAILKVLKEENLLTWIDAIVTVYVVQNPPRLEEALQCIIALTGTSSASAEIVEKSMKYLLFLVPAEKLFDVALGMYELPLTLSIGRRSQKDPKDFEPFLEELYKLPELERKFRINDHLQRYAKALECLFLNPQSEEEQFLSYMKKYNLFKEAIVITSSSNSLYVQVLNAFGEHLMVNNDASNAVCCFRRSGNWQKVVEAAIPAGCWMEYLNATRRLSRSNVEAVEIEALIRTLRTQSNLKEAVQFAKLSGLSEEFVFNLAVEMGLFSEAALIAEPNEHFLVSLDGHGQKLFNRLNELFTDFQSKTERMLRIQRAFLTSASNSNNTVAVNANSGNVDDNISEMSFRTSNTTIKTRTTNASRRSNTSSKRTERNRTRDRPGSPFEREFLLFNIRNLIGQIHKIAAEVKETLKCLVQFGCNQDLALNLPRSIHECYGKLCKSVFNFVEEFRKIQAPQIWGFNSNGQAVNENGVLIENPLVDPLEAKFEIPAEFGLPANWEIKLF